MAKANENGIPTFSMFFIYFSGHGRMIDGRTIGVDPYDKDTPLEKFVKDLSIKRNTTTIGFFDCCRDEKTYESKGTDKVQES